MFPPSSKTVGDSFTHLFIRLANQHPRSPGSTSLGNIHHRLALARALVVGRLVDSETETLASLDHRLPQESALLANASRKHEGVDLAAQLQVVIPDVAEDTVYDDIERELVAGARGVLDGDLGEVGGARQGLPPGLLVEDFFGLGEGVSCAALHFEQCPKDIHTVLMCISLVLAGLNLPASLV